MIPEFSKQSPTASSPMYTSSFSLLSGDTIIDSVANNGYFYWESALKKEIVEQLLQELNFEPLSINIEKNFTPNY